ncbi:LVIVD repeat-containing protein [Halomarina oriensis]|uniref:LVIVD repeat-containing protein n=1 Tax=Halomarina oriensis TaxID=671145 RepID=A0A6B0GLM0_9EURY|nr:hypothetical protein [Halomarina oriensis]MWG35550.1 hypothetical protein [Halomarina oriensis]
MESSDGHSRRTVLRSLGAVATLPALSTLADVAVATPAQDDYGPLGRLAVDGTTEAVVSGDVAYLAVTDGFATVDVSDPASPSLLAEERGLLTGRENGPLQQVWDVKVEDDRLLVAGPANGRQDAVNALVLYDVADPASPERVGVYETESANHNVFLADGVAYRPNNYANGTESENELVAIDVEGGEELGRWSPVDADPAWGDVFTGLRPLHDLYVQDGVAYLAYWDAGTWLLDVSDPASPSVVSRVGPYDPADLSGLSQGEAQAENYQPPGNSHYVAVNDDASLLGVGVESWDVDPDDAVGGPGGVTLYDISDPASPRELSTITPPPSDDPTLGGVWTTSHNFDFAGDRLYTSWYRGGVKVFDVSDPARPGVLREWADREAMSFWTAQALTPGETFVGAAENHRSNPGQFEGLVVFPDAPADEQSTRTQTPVATDDGTTDDGSVTPYPPPPTYSSETVTTTGAETTDESSGFGPGFGVVAGIAGTGLAAWRLLGKRDDEG